MLADDVRDFFLKEETEDTNATGPLDDTTIGEPLANIRREPKDGIFYMGTGTDVVVVLIFLFS